MTMQDELAPCPFCLSHKVRLHRERSHFVMCDSCGATGPEILYNKESFSSELEERAIAAWNRYAATKAEGAPTADSVCVTCGKPADFRHYWELNASKSPDADRAILYGEFPPAKAEGAQAPVAYPDSACESHKNLRTSEPVCLVCMANETERLRAELEKRKAVEGNAVAWLYPRNKFSGKEDDFEVCKMQPENRHKVGAFPVYRAPPSLPDSALVREARERMNADQFKSMDDMLSWIEQRAREISSAG